MKDVVIIHGVPTLNKTWRRNWFWVGGNWRADFDPKLLLEKEHVFNEIQGQVDWGTVSLSKEKKERIKLALSIEEES